MRITVVTRRIERVGGAETYVETISNALIAHGHPLSLLVSEPPAGREPLEISPKCEIFVAGPDLGIAYGF